MAGIGNGYGSECHLLRYLGRHRHALDRAVGAATGAAAIDWLDFPFDPGNAWLDGELKGLDFLGAETEAALAWRKVWPVRGNTLNWDAVGKADIAGVPTWLLVEAKAHTKEIESRCGASVEGGRPLIEATMARVKADLGVSDGMNWLAPFYQFCNRITALHHLHRHGVPAKLVLICFTGDRFPDDAAPCPPDREGWRQALDAMDAAAGIPESAEIRQHIHEVFLPVADRPRAKAPVRWPVSKPA